VRPSRHRFAGCLFGLCAAALVGVLAWKIRFLETGWCSAWHLYSLNVTCYVCVLFALALRYKPRRERTFEPELSIVLPVKNEEQVIGQAMSSCYEAAYPAEKRQVIVINDGSTDRTGAALEALRTRYPDLEVVTWECNRGKIHGMVEGLKRARGELVVFLDSDTVLERDALRAIAAEFHDPTVGAVSGHVDVLNAGVNFLTSAQAVWYFGAFRVFRAAEHLLSNVTCCPVAFCAYRAEYVAPVVEPWLQTRVLGIPCTHGVDRGLTNQILRCHRVRYCSEAVAWTVAPDTWAEFLRQQVRWKKSWIRETLVACSFMYRKPPCTALFFYWSVSRPVSAADCGAAIDSSASKERGLTKPEARTTVRRDCAGGGPASPAALGRIASVSCPRLFAARARRTP